MFFRLSVLSVVLSEPLTQKHNYQSVLFFFPFQGTPWLHHSIGLVNPDITYWSEKDKVAIHFSACAPCLRGFTDQASAHHSQTTESVDIL